MSFDISIKIAGQAGQGLQSISELLIKVLKTKGMHVFAVQDYMSRIRGGHNFMQIRISDNPIHSMQEHCDILIALDKNSETIHKSEVPEGGSIIYDPHSIQVDSPDKRYLPIPLYDLSKEVGGVLFSNMISAGSISALLGLDTNDSHAFIKKQFAKKGEEIISKNMKALESGYSYVLKNLGNRKYRELKSQNSNKLMLMNGSEAVGFGAVAGGCQFISAYPMTPSTGIFEYLTRKAKYFNIVSEQAEDEIAAINMALGASFAGARAMTTTSGGGLSLMAEGISLSGAMETPIVIVNAQRPGPATGLPTRTGQEDLEYVLHIGHGEFPRFVFAPGHPEEAFYTTIHAFNLTDKYQVPVFILIDQYLADTYVTLNEIDLTRVKSERYFLENGKNMNHYLRYKLTKNGVSPRAYPLQGDFTVIADCHEHTEDGHITEEIEVRNKMVKKRFEKLKDMQDEFGTPIYYGNDKAKTIFLTWGSSYGVVRETVDYLNRQRNPAAMIHFNRIYPFPKNELEMAIKDTREIIAVEGNFQGQFSHFMKAETGIEVNRKILKYDGRPFTVNHILKNLTI